MMLRNPLVVILGATGTGKTKLAVQICKRFNGEIVNMDSMQIYQGLDISTNKATDAELEGVPQHMHNFLSASVIDYNVVAFRDQTLQVLQQLWARSRLPVLVGGTSYYLEAVVWQHLASPALDHMSEGAAADNPLADMANWTSERLHSYLMDVDEQSANQLHPNNRRKLMHALRIHRQTKQPMSQLLNEQHETEGASTVSGPLRFSECVMLWLNTQAEHWPALMHRLDQRVLQMVHMGLRNELETFYDQHYAAHKQTVMANRPSGSLHDSELFTTGVFQSIGLKEFRPYLELTAADRNSELGDKQFNAGVSRLQTVTRQYARRQVKYVRNRLLKYSDRQVPPIYQLDCGSVADWGVRVGQPAMDIVQSYLAQDTQALSAWDSHLCTPLNTQQSHTLQHLHANTVSKCVYCNVHVSGEAQWLQHANSKRHKYVRSKYLRQRQMTCDLSADNNGRQALGAPEID